MTKQLEDEPINIRQALSCSDATQWKDATIKEIQALENLNSWTVVSNIPPGHKPLTSRMVYRKKVNIN
ncbi:hypothetical protein HK096_001114, partial [Nowakowskiella sp. JEL0078]